MQILPKIPISELSGEQKEELCSLAEKAAQKHVFAAVDPKEVERLNVSVEAEGEKPLNIEVEIDLRLSSKMEGCDVDQLARGAVEKAFEAIEKFLSKPS